jgi:hypothetical protein
MLQRYFRERIAEEDLQPVFQQMTDRLNTERKILSIRIQGKAGLFCLAVSFGCNHSSVQETLFSQFGDQPLMIAVYRDDYTDFSRSSRNLKCANPEQFKEYISGLTICEGCIDREMMTDKAALILHFGEDQSEYAVAVYNHMIGIVKSSEPEYDRLFWLDRKTDWNQLLSFFEKQHDCLSSGKQRSYCIHF